MESRPIAPTSCALACFDSYRGIPEFFFSTHKTPFSSRSPLFHLLNDVEKNPPLRFRIKITSCSAVIGLRKKEMKSIFERGSWSRGETLKINASLGRIEYFPPSPFAGLKLRANE